MARNNSRSRRSRASASDGNTAAGSDDNPYRTGTNAHSAFERMKRRRERDAAFAKTPEGKRSAAFHNALPTAETEASTESSDFDPIEHEGSGNASDSPNEPEA